MCLINRNETKMKRQDILIREKRQEFQGDHKGKRQMRNRVSST